MGKKLIQLENITKTYDGNMILDDLNLYVKENEFLTPVSYTHLDVYKRQFLRRCSVIIFILRINIGIIIQHCNIKIVGKIL